MPLKVGRDKIKDTKKGIIRTIAYNDIKTDCDGWVDASKYLPADFDLMHLRTATKKLNGWSFGNGWDGRYVRDDDQILFWKRFV